MRVTECSFGAGFYELGDAILGEFLGPNVTVISKRDPGAVAAMQDLLRRASEVETIEGSAGTLTAMSGSMPDSNLN